MPRISDSQLDKLGFSVAKAKNEDKGRVTKARSNFIEAVEDGKLTKVEAERIGETSPDIFVANKTKKRWFG